MRISVIGLGLIGKERIEALLKIAANESLQICSAFDINEKTRLYVKEKYLINVCDTLDSALSCNPDWVFIATTNDVVKDICEKAFLVGANVLIEKPFGRSLSEAESILKIKPENLQLKVGFNYRFFAGVEKAINDVKLGKFGKLISVNMVLGHGNAPGMEKSWRFNPEKCGDSATDLGVHLLDLCYQFSKTDISIKYAQSWRGFWNTGIDEESHIFLSDSDGTMFNIQTSLNRWRSSFKLEINGTEGYGVVEGRGKNYGPQSYKVGKRWGWAGGKTQAESEEVVINQDDCMDSFFKETLCILNYSNLDITSTAASSDESLKVMKLLEQYRVLK